MEATNRTERVDIAENNQFEILRSLREGMLAEMQEFRAAMWKSMIATQAFVIAIVGWLFTKGISFETTQKVFLCVGISIFFATCLLVVSALKRHFTDHAIVINRINHLFGSTTLANLFQTKRYSSTNSHGHILVRKA